MIIEQQSNVLSSAGLQSTSQFQIKTSAHAFRILSSGLYSDKIRAVLREIGCNAADAHIAAGTPDLPFEVHLPSALNPKFYIKDFGPGLSQEEIFELYTTYFSSSKSNSNDFTGAFGLGSKSPFSYTDSFTVVSVKDGIKTTYTAYVGHDGAPTISKVAEAPADENWPHGLMVSMPVKPQDFTEFKLKAQTVFSWFSVLPTMVNSEAITRPEFSVDTDEFAIPRKSYAQDEPSVLMGNVRYPIPHHEAAKYPWMIHTAVVLKLPIGAVDVAASREHLEFTQKTREAIKFASSRVLSHMGQEVVTTLRAFDKNKWSGLKKISECLTNSYTTWSYVLEDLLHAGGMTKDEANFYLNFVEHDYNPPVPSDFEGKVTANWRDYTGRIRKYSRHFIASTSANDRQYIPANLRNNAAIVLRGTTKYVNDRVRHALQSNTYDTLILVGNDDAEAEEAAKKWYDFPTVKAEDLELPADWVPPSKRQKKSSRQKSIDSLTCTMYTINKDGTTTKDPNCRVANVNDDQKYCVNSYVAWGERKWRFGNGRSECPENEIKELAKVLCHISNGPRGIALFDGNAISRYKLVEKHGWKDVKEIHTLLIQPSTKGLVDDGPRQTLSHVYNDGMCYETGSPLKFIASHAKCGTKFWNELKAIAPNSALVQAAESLTTNCLGVVSGKLISVNDYNRALRTFQDWNNMVQLKSGNDSSRTIWSSFASVLSQQFPNHLVKRDPALAARVVAELIAADETNLPRKELV